MLQAQNYWSARKKSEEKMEGNVNNNQTKLNMSFHDKKPNDKFHKILPIACTPLPPSINIFVCLWNSSLPAALHQPTSRLLHFDARK